MPTASDYPVTFGYGATDGVYYGTAAKGKPTYVGPYHRGDDRAMPYGTPVVVNGTTIGLSGDGNGRYGAHLHVGKFVGGAAANPYGQGFQLDSPKVVAIVDQYTTDPVNAKYVHIQDATGAKWVYLHLSQINVKVGDTLGGEVDSKTEEILRSAINSLTKTNETLASALNAARASDEVHTSALYAARDEIEQLKKQPLSTKSTVLGPGLWEVKG